MDRCILKIISDEKIEEKTCDQIREEIDKMKSDFKKNNSVIDASKDNHYKMYCKELDDFIDQCRCEPPNGESRVGRNIRVARERRERNWKKT